MVIANIFSLGLVTLGITITWMMIDRYKASAEGQSY